MTIVAITVCWADKSVLYSSYWISFCLVSYCRITVYIKLFDDEDGDDDNNDTDDDDDSSVGDHGLCICQFWNGFFFSFFTIIV